MSVDLPLKIRADIRDRWESPKAPIQASVDSLAETLGHRLVPRIEWPLFYNSLKDRFPDKGTFVPTISQIVNTFYLRLLSKLEDEASLEWTEEFLGVLAKRTPGSTFPLRIEASAKAGPRPRVSWKAELGSFYLEIPNSDPALPAMVEAGFDQDLDNLLAGPNPLNDDKWAEVTGLDTQPAINPHIVVQPKAIVEHLPKLDMLARPAELFKNTAPYILIVDAHAQPFTIQGSHQQSLELLASYLKKFSKTNLNNGLKRHYLQINLIESLFCDGVIDTITIEPYSSYRYDKDSTLNPTLILAFVEGTLGYKLVHTTGVRWVYNSGTNPSFQYSIRTLVELNVVTFRQRPSSYHSSFRTATYLPSNVPPTTENGQTGTNQCGTALNQTSNCQNAYINSVTDFCVFAPPNPGPDAVIGNTERIEVAWCTKNGTGARLIPDGAITGAHFVQTPDFVQVTGIGNLQLINIPAGDGGGELDPHGADGNGNPIGGLVFSSAFGQLEQIHEWTNFVGVDQFCFRACKPGPLAPTFCQHIYDVMGCEWNMPANYDPGFESCQGDSGEPMGVYGSSTFFQGQPATPAAHPRPSSSSCATLSTIANGFHIAGTSIELPVASSTGTSAQTSGGVSSNTFSSIATLTSIQSAPGITNLPSSATGAIGSSSSPSSSSSSSASRFTDQWERIIFTVGSAIVCSMFGALFVL